MCTLIDFCEVDYRRMKYSMGYLKVALILSTASSVFSETFLPVLTSCRYWDRLEIYSDSDPEALHCIMDQDKIPGIVYTEWIAVPKEMCPIYNRHARNIDCIPCNGSIGTCPTTQVRSYQAVAYTGCFQMPLMEQCVKAEVSTPGQELHSKDMDKYFVISISMDVLNLATTITGAIVGLCIWIKIYRYNPFEAIKYRTLQKKTSNERISKQMKKTSDRINGDYKMVKSDDSNPGTFAIAERSCYRNPNIKPLNTECSNKQNSDERISEEIKRSCGQMNGNFIMVKNDCSSLNKVTTTEKNFPRNCHSDPVLKLSSATEVIDKGSGE